MLLLFIMAIKKRSNTTVTGKIRSEIKRETLQAIFSILFFVLALLSILAPLHMADPVGKYIYNFLTIWFGFGYYLLPVTFILTAISLQSNNSGLIEKGQSDRKNLIASFLGLDIYEKLCVLGKDKIKEVDVILKQFLNSDFSTKTNIHGFKAGIPKRETSVIFVPNLKGRFKLLTNGRLTKEEQCNVEYHEAWEDSNTNYSRPLYEFRPVNTHLIAAIDGIKAKDVKDSKRASKGSMAVLRVRATEEPTKIDENGLEIDPYPPKFICIYLARPVEAIFADDMAKALFFFGCQAVVEDVDGTTMKGLIDLGMLPFISHEIDVKDKLKPTFKDMISRGQHTGKAEHDAIGKAIEDYVEFHCKEIEFDQITGQWKSLTAKNFTKLDLVISTGYCLLRASMKTFKEKYDKKDWKQFQTSNVVSYIRDIF